MVSDVEFSSRGIVLRGRWQEPAAPPPYPAVIFLTGDGAVGSESPTWAKFARMLTTRGVATFGFDFAGLGRSDGLRPGEVRRIKL